MQVKQLAFFCFSNYNMVRLFRHKRLLLLLCLGTIIICCVLLVVSPLNNNLVVRKFYYLIYPEESIGCYRLYAESLPDISDVNPRKGKSIFFHETSCSSFSAGKVRKCHVRGVICDNGMSSELTI